jgi:hypothetical protein
MPLTAGKHILISERIEPDMYTEMITNIRSYPLGSNARIEYEIHITPDLDLISVPVLVDSINDSRISSFTLASATGETIKDKEQVSETQIRAMVLGLKKDRTTVLTVGYKVEDIESFVEEQINQLESGNVSSEAQALLDQAKDQADSGNYNKALELIEESKALAKVDETETTKLQARCDDMAAKLVAELDEITMALNASNASTPFIEKITARKTELERVLEDTAGLNLTEKADALGKVDYGWLGKELNAFRKQAYSGYNDLKARFFAAGNSSTPESFLEFEAALHKLDSGGRLEYATTVSDALSAVRTLVEAQEQLTASGKTELKAIFDGLESDLNDVLDRYSKQAAAAKGTDYSGLFTESSTRLSKLLSETKSALSGDPRIAWPKLRDLNNSMKRMDLTLETLMDESESKLAVLERLVENSKLDDGKKTEFRKELDRVRNMISSGEYINALRTGSAIAKELEGAESGDDSGFAVLGLSAIAIIAAIGFYIMKQEPKKELRKIPSSNELFKPVQEKPPEGPKAPEPEPAA